MSLRSLLALFSCAVAPLAMAACADPPAPKVPAPKRIEASAPKVEEPIPTSDLVPVGKDDPTMGPADARLTMVVFSDFQCPFCSRVEPTLARLREAFGTELRVVWKDNPLKFHKFAREAAVIGRVVFELRGNDAFWHFHDTVFSNQKDLSLDTLHAWAAEANVGPDDVEKGRAAAEAKIDASLDLGARAGITGTPGFVIDGERITGARPFQEFAMLLDRHLGEAKALEEKGVARPAIYGELVRAHFTANKPEEDEEETVDQTVYRVEIGDAPVRGSADALVTIVEFADFQCPFCKRNDKTLVQLRNKYGSKVRFVFKHAPLSFHERAMPAAIFAVEARKQGGDVAFFKAHDALYASPALDTDAFSRIATEIGIDPKKALDAVQKESWKPLVERDQAEGEDLDVKGTPCTFVNGRRVEGAQSLAVFEKVVDEELKKAESKVAGGLPAAKVYAETIAGGKGGTVDLAIPKGAPWRGGEKAKVVIQVFSDFQCPYCKRLEVRAPDDQDGKTGALAAVAKKYGDKIKIVWRDFPLDFHARARAAAVLGREALAQKGRATFWKVHDALFEAQGDFSDESLEAIAKKHGVDWKKVKSAIDQGTWSSAIDEDVKEGNRAGVSGTPTLIVDGHRIVGAQPEAVLSRAIDRALALRAK